jgi:predicted nucleic acid-binding protein
VNQVVDASVACKWYLDEPDSDKARKLVEAGNDPLIAPDLILAEVGSVLWKRRLKNEITQAQAEEAVWHLPGVLQIVPSKELLVRALEMAVMLRHPIYDCFYAAAAERWDARLITDDRRFFAALSGGKVKLEVKRLSSLR